MPSKGEILLTYIIHINPPHPPFPPHLFRSLKNIKARSAPEINHRLPLTQVRDGKGVPAAQTQIRFRRRGGELRRRVAECGGDGVAVLVVGGVVGGGGGAIVVLDAGVDGLRV